MTNKDLIAVVEGGMLNATNRTLEISDAYKVVKFRNVIKTAFNRFRENEKSLLAEVGVMDAQVFDAELDGLRNKERNKAEEERFAELNKILSNYFGLRGELLNEEVNISEIKAMPYEQWYKFCQENIFITPELEDALENILWVAPDTY